MATTTKTSAKSASKPSAKKSSAKKMTKKEQAAAAKAKAQKAQEPQMLKILRMMLTSGISAPPSKAAIRPF